MTFSLATVLPFCLSFAVVAQDNAALRRDIERRFDVLPLQNGLALHPKRGAAGVRSVELTDGTIALDGAAATGTEVRQRLGADADLIIRLSYLDADARRRLFSTSGASQQVELPKPPEPPSPPAPARNRRSGDRVKFGGSVTVRPDEVVNGDVVVIGGSAHVDGEVTGDLVVIGGVAELGPTAYVKRDVTVVGGALRRDERARIGGSVNEVGAGGLGALSRDGLLRNRRFRSWNWGFGSFFALVTTMTRLAVLSLLVSLVLLLGREYVERVGARAAAEPLKAGLVGVLAQLLFLPLLIVTIVVLVITIVGIPLLVLIPFALLALAIILLVGFTAVAYHLGRVVNTRFGWAVDNPYATAILGVVVLLSPVLIARILGLAGGLLFPLTITLVGIGIAFEYVAWTVGLGAVALLRFERKTLEPQPSA